MALVDSDNALVLLPGAEAKRTRVANGWLEVAFIGLQVWPFLKCIHKQGCHSRYATQEETFLNASPTYSAVTCWKTKDIWTQGSQLNSKEDISAQRWEESLIVKIRF